MLLKTEWAKIGFNIKKRRFSIVVDNICSTPCTKN